MGGLALSTNRTDPTEIGRHGVSRVLVAGFALALLFVAGSVKAVSGDDHLDTGLGIAEMLMGSVLFAACLRYRTIGPIAALYGAFF